jgi:hypothetical protein
MCQPFHNDEESYERWMRQNSSGWVFNNFKGNNPSYNKLHHLPCGQLTRPSDAGRRTTVEKICCNVEREILGTVANIRGHGGWEYCSFCH